MTVPSERRHVLRLPFGTFELIEEARGRPSPVAWPDGYEALAIVVASCWIYSPERFLGSVLDGTGQGFEGVVSFGYHDGYPDEIAEGCVSCSYLDETTELELADFEAYVLAYAELAAGTSDEPLSELAMARIEALRARRAPPCAPRCAPP